MINFFFNFDNVSKILLIMNNVINCKLNYFLIKKIPLSQKFTSIEFYYA